MEERMVCLIFMNNGESTLAMSLTAHKNMIKRGMESVRELKETVEVYTRRYGQPIGKIITPLEFDYINRKRG